MVWCKRWYKKDPTNKLPKSYVFLFRNLCHIRYDHEFRKAWSLWDLIALLPKNFIKSAFISWLKVGLLLLLVLVLVFKMCFFGINTTLLKNILFIHTFQVHLDDFKSTPTGLTLGFLRVLCCVRHFFLFLSMTFFSYSQSKLYIYQ